MPDAQMPEGEMSAETAGTAPADGQAPDGPVETDGPTPDDSALGHTVFAEPRRPPRPPRATRSPFSGCLKAIGILVLSVAAVVLVAFIALFLQLREMGRTPDPIKAPVMWTTQEVVLTSSQPIVYGRLSIRSGATAGRPVTIGLNAGAAATAAPSSSPSPHVPSPSTPAASLTELGAALSTRPVRLTATDAQGVAHRCAAPCELKLETLSCASGGCAATFDVMVELLGGARASSGPVIVRISGGGSGSLGDALPSGFSVDLALESPAASGGQ